MSFPLGTNCVRNEQAHHRPVPVGAEKKDRLILLFLRTRNNSRAKNYACGSDTFTVPADVSVGAYARISHVGVLYPLDPANTVVVTWIGPTIFPLRVHCKEMKRGNPVGQAQNQLTRRNVDGPTVSHRRPFHKCAGKARWVVFRICECLRHVQI